LQDSIFENDDENTVAKKRDEIGKMTAAILRLTECACENKDDCIIYKMQNEGKILNKSRKKKLAMDVEEILNEGEKELSPGVNEDDYEDDTDTLVTSTQKKRDGSLIRKVNRKGKQNSEKLNESSLNGHNKNSSLEENEISGQITRKEKKKSKEIDTITKSDNIAQSSQKSKGKESVNRIREETPGNIKRKSMSSRKTEKNTGNKYARSSSISKTGSKRRLPQHDDDEEGQHSDSSLSSLISNSEMSIDDDFPNVSIMNVNPSNADTNNPDEPTNKDNNEDQLSGSRHSGLISYLYI